MIIEESLRNITGYGTDMKLKTILLALFLSTGLIGASYAELSFAELSKPSGKVMDEKLIRALYKDNLNNNDSIIFICSGRQVSSFIAPKIPGYPIEPDAAIFTNRSLDWEKVRQKFGEDVSFIISVDSKGIALIGGGLALINPDPGSTDHIKYRDFLIFFDSQVSKFWPWKEFSTARKRMKYGRHFSGTINRYTGDINISLDRIRSKSKDSYSLKASCEKTKRMF